MAIGRSFIEVQHIKKSFHEQQVLKDMSFTIKEGQTVGLLGPNGSGKQPLSVF
ncbi:ATP-binding cassette domain-containing protein [Ectobacillus funiculus]|uniref:ATP-binding cassette domain-containing protein n=1 Tax=Ectobacillus funiculus TaxID=137993 RepID=UPI003978CA4D